MTANDIHLCITDINLEMHFTLSTTIFIPPYILSVSLRVFQPKLGR